MQLGTCLSSPDVHLAVVGGVEGYLVARNSVRAFHDVDLAVHRPVGRVCEPERRPERAAKRSMLDVEDEETRIVRGLGLDAGGEAARARVYVVTAVDTEDSRRCACKCEIVGFGVNRIGVAKFVSGL